MLPKTAIFIVAFAAIFAIGYLYAHDPASHNYLSCPLFLLTGWQCPFCGSTRALYSILHFDFAAAWRLNPLFCMVFGFAPIHILLDYTLIQKKYIVFLNTFFRFEIAIITLFLFFIIRNLLSI